MSECSTQYSGNDPQEETDETYFCDSAGYLCWIRYCAAIPATPPRPGPPPQQDPWAYGPGPQTWNQGWNNRPNPHRGACFYTTAGFQGNHFCVRAGDSLPRLPGNFGDNIFRHSGFWRSQSPDFQRPELFERKHLDKQKRGRFAQRSIPRWPTWNNRVSSMLVR